MQFGLRNRQGFDLPRQRLQACADHERLGQLVVTKQRITAGLIAFAVDHRANDPRHGIVVPCSLGTKCPGDHLAIHAQGCAEELGQIRAPLIRAGDGIGLGRHKAVHQTDECHTLALLFEQVTHHQRQRPAQ
ncbi:hypothetical protein D3C72_1858960 [compost metagenome]